MDALHVVRAGRAYLKILYTIVCELWKRWHKNYYYRIVCVCENVLKCLRVGFD